MSKRVAIIGAGPCGLAQLRAFQSAAAKGAEAGVCVVANDNNPGNIVISGSKAGVDAAIAQLAAHHLRIAQPGGEESLNVAAAAAICLHASATGRLAPPA